jgi:type I restriction enzyme S subunit
MNKVKVKLKDIATVKNGSTPSTSNPAYYDGDIIWITPKDLSNQNKRYINRGERTITKEGFDSCSASLVPKGSVLMSSRAPIGLLSIAETELCTNQGFKNFVPDTSKIDSEFLYYYLKIKINDIDKLGSGTTFKEVSKSSIENFDLLIPEKTKDQQKIASVLSALDSKIELNNRINAELEAMAKTLYDYWFVQFDFPNAKGKPYKTSGGKMEWNEELKREIPEGWEVQSLFDVCNVQYGFPFSTNYFNEDGNGLPVIRIRDILENSVSNYSTEPNIDKKYLINKGDLLIGMDGNFHINYWTVEGCYLNQRVVKLNETILPNIYLRYQIEPFIKLREQSVSRTTVGHLSDKDLKAIRVIVPSKPILDSIRILYKNSLYKIIQNQIENQKLTELRDWLLPMLMNGQVKVN